MTRLNDAAKATLREAGVSQAAWARAQGYSDGRWHGDACGCPDDRCIGFHHGDADDECGCLRVLLAELASRPPCPPWCADHLLGAVHIHQSAHRAIRLDGHGGYLAAYAWQAASGPLTARHVSVRATRAGADTVVMLRDPDAARALAELVDQLADATPEQHRELAAQVRRAAAVLDGQDDDTSGGNL